MNLRKYLVPLAALIISATGSGCGDDDHDHDHEEEEPVEEACEHSQEGPFEDVTAGVDAASAADITFEHTAVNVATDAGAGFVTFEAEEDGDFLFFLSADVPIALTDATGTMIAAEATETTDHCAEVAVSYTYELEVGTYTIAIGPDAPATVTFVVEHGEHDHEEEE